MKTHYGLLSGMLLITGACLLPATAYTAELMDGDTIIDHVNARDEGEHVSRKLTMTLTDKRGKERVRETIGYRRYYGDEKRSVLFYLSPSNIRDTGFLTFDYPDPKVDDDQWLYLPAARKVRRISAADRGDYFLGTDFSYEDIKKESKFEKSDYTFKTLGEEDIDGHPTYKVEAVPKDDKTAKELGYGRVLSWIDPEIWMSRKADFWDVRGNFLKTIYTKNIEQIDGIWTSLHIQATNHKTGHASDFVFTDVDYETVIEDDVFSERALRRGAQGD